MEKIAGIIAEYNPFHNGHAYQVRTLKEDLGFAWTIAVLGGEFVQRGEPALTSQRTRCKMALLGGVDLVLSLGPLASVSSAPDFASAGVRILDHCGCATHLAFGCETPDPALLTKTAALSLDESPQYTQKLQALQKEGFSFPAAREEALRSLAGELPEGFLREPNNILGIEYVQAILREHASLTPLPMQRSGEDYHSAALPSPGSFASASAIRNTLSDPACTRAALAPFMQEDVLTALLRALEDGDTWSAPKWDAVVGAALLTGLRAPGQPDEAAGGSPLSAAQSDLLRRIALHLPEYAGAESFAALLKTRQVTLSRVRRTLAQTALHLREAPGAYIRVLGFRESARPLLRRLCREASWPVIIKPAAAASQLDPRSLRAFEEELRAEALYRTLSPVPGTKTGSGYTRSPQIVSS